MHAVDSRSTALGSAESAQAPLTQNRTSTSPPGLHHLKCLKFKIPALRAESLGSAGPLAFSVAYSEKHLVCSTFKIQPHSDCSPTFTATPWPEPASWPSANTRITCSMVLLVPNLGLLDLSSENNLCNMEGRTCCLCSQTQQGLPFKVMAKGIE